jgi:hypothetical protein
MEWGEHREEEKPAPEQRVRRVRDLNLLGRFVERVLEGGIKVCARSTIFHITDSSER